jgi:pre-mRNA-splicing factor ATP-dependent RNA helicase DHX15/PRP43
MTVKRTDFAEDDGTSRAKRVKTESNGKTMEPGSNPYLAHWNEEPKSKFNPHTG